MTVYFISDLHLQPARDDLAQAFYHFVDETVGDGDTLYILGDFFDAWIGDDEDHPFYLQVKAKLSSLHARSIDVLFMHGNRDFLVRQQFAGDTHVTLLSEPSEIELAGKKILLMHGDSLCTQDVEYMAFRQQVRNIAWQDTVLAVPLAQRRIMAAELRNKSQSMNSNKADDIMDVTPSEVERILDEYQADILLHGHTHRPARHALENTRERIVLGDWGSQGWYVRVDDSEIELHNFTID